jgi:hypothetical protein
VSHFTVAVFTEPNGKLVEELLVPYQENNMGDCPKEYLKFNSIEDEYLENYNNDGVEMVKTPDGRLIYPWDNEFQKPGEIGYGTNTHEVPANKGYEKIFIKYNEKYNTFEEYMKDFCGYDKRDEITGEYGYWENPNAQWDWYSIGGRWNGSLLVRVTADGEIGSLGLGGYQHEKTNPAPKGYKWVDVAKVKDIEWNLMRELKIKEAENNWEKAQKEENESMKYFGYGIHKDDSKETYVDRQTEFNTYAVITPDGIWHSKGKMGWWGCSSETEDEDIQWRKGFEDIFVKNADTDLMITIVDCHI